MHLAVVQNCMTRLPGLTVLMAAKQHGALLCDNMATSMQRRRKAVAAMREPAHLVFVRHGQTDWNVEQRMQGQSTADPAPALTEAGTAQAHTLAAHLRVHLADTMPSCVVTSDLQRARQVLAAACADGRCSGVPALAGCCMAAAPARLRQACAINDGLSHPRSVASEAAAATISWPRAF